jgi:benzodiazapine receptor
VYKRQTINKPSFNPPNWIFAPVWTALYVMIATSGWMVWQKLSGGFAQKIKSLPMKIFALQMLANFLWSILFFGMQAPLFAAIDISIMLFLIGLNIYIFRKTSLTAALLLVPYFLWVSFASLLNLSIVFLN